jgi:hypothetical protein
MSVDRGNGAVSQQTGEIAGLLDGHVAIPQIRLLIGAVVRVVVERAAAETVEVLVAASQWTVRRQRTQVPLTDEGRRITRLPEQRGEGRMLGRQPDVTRRRWQRLLETDAQPVLVAAGDQSNACRGADRRIRIRLQQAHAVGRETIDVRRA